MLRLILVFFVLFPVYAQAADDDLQRAVEEVQKETPKSNAQVENTGTELANAYFKECLSTDRPKYTDKIHELICGCTSANMSQTLSTNEIKILKTENKQGRNVRAKFLINAFVPCMHEATEEIAMNSCKESDYLKKHVLSGRKKICTCIVEKFTSSIKQREAQILTIAVGRDPNTLDPLHDYLSTDEYKNSESNLINKCYNVSKIRM